MKKLTAATAYWLLAWSLVPAAHAGLGDFLNDIKSVLIKEDALSNGEVVDGLKRALSVGTRNTVAYVSKTDGYFSNPQIKIPLPDKFQKNHFRKTSGDLQADHSKRHG